LCRHLLGEGVGELDTFWVLRGVGVECDLCCGPCATAAPDRDLVVACEGCVDSADGRWSVIGVTGEPEIWRRPEPVNATRSRKPLPGVPLDVAPLDRWRGEWLVLTVGQLLRWHSGTGEVVARWQVRLPDPGPERKGGKPARHRLLASPAGHLAVIAVDYRRRANGTWRGVLQLGMQSEDVEPPRSCSSRPHQPCVYCAAAPHRSGPSGHDRRTGAAAGRTSLRRRWPASSDGRVRKMIT
jgi:hypothetical protein